MDFADLAYAGAARQAELLRSGELSSRELTEGYLRRIEELDPRLNAFRSVYSERALAEADQADARLRAGDGRPLLGVPVAVKDNVNVAGDTTGYGTRDPLPAATADSEAVARLRAAGAVLLGKTHLPELAIWPFTESAAHGITRNPWRLDRTSGGSSGGSATAVAGGLAPIALGSDGGGSIRIPSACCGLFGIKPQRGRVPLDPPGEHWYGLTAFGPIARRVSDSALMLDVLAGGGSTFSDAARGEPGRLRIAVSRRPPIRARMEAPMLAAIDATAEMLRGLGHEVAEHDPDYGELRTLFGPLWLRGIADDARTLVPPGARLEPRTRQMAALGRLVPDALVRRVRRGQAELVARLAATFESFDALLCPALAAPAVEAGRWEGRGALRTFVGVASWTPGTVVWNLTGQPAASLPAGLTGDGLPLSAQLVTRAGDEATIFSLGAQLERARGWVEKRPPL